MIAALAWLALASAPAEAHQFRPTLLRADVGSDGHHSVTWKWDGLDPRGIPGDELDFGDGCVAAVTDATDGTEQSAFFDIRCDEGPLVVHFPSTPMEVVLDLRQDGIPRRVERLVLVPQELDLSAMLGPIGEDDEGPVNLRSWLRLGVEHIWFGWDHLCFAIALTLLVGSLRKVAGVVTGFTLGHSVTLAGATLAWLPRPHGAPVEAVIALSVLYLAVEMTRGDDARARFASGLGFAIATSFGLVHGFGFAGALSEFALPESAELPALAMFNVGVELGQLAVVAAVLTLRRAAIGNVERVHRERAERWLRFATAYFVGSVAVYWLTERTLTIVSG